MEAAVMLRSWLEQHGYQVFPDRAKRWHQGGVDLVAYQPERDTLDPIGSAAQKGTIKKETAISFGRLGVENLDGVRDTLDESVGFSAEVRRALVGAPTLLGPCPGRSR
jgi:hypothetical protein